MPVFVSGADTDKPPCFGYAEVHDPACGRCVLYEACFKALLAHRPPCFGSYDGTLSPCLLCILQSSCRESPGKEVSGEKEPVTLTDRLEELDRKVEALLPKPSKSTKKVRVKRKKRKRRD